MKIAFTRSPLPVHWAGGYGRARPATPPAPRPAPPSINHPSTPTPSPLPPRTPRGGRGTPERGIAAAAGTGGAYRPSPAPCCHSAKPRPCSSAHRYRSGLRPQRCRIYRLPLTPSGLPDNTKEGSSQRSHRPPARSSSRSCSLSFSAAPLPLQHQGSAGRASTHSSSAHICRPSSVMTSSLRCGCFSRPELRGVSNSPRRSVRVSTTLLVCRAPTGIST